MIENHGGRSKKMLTATTSYFLITIIKPGV